MKEKEWTTKDDAREDAKMIDISESVETNEEAKG